MIKKFVQFRRKTEYIVIIPTTCMIQGDFYIDPVIYQHKKLFVQGIWEKYFLKDLKKPALPYHYYIERIGEDYYVAKGLPDMMKSYFIADLVRNGIVDPKYTHSIVIASAENFNIEAPRRRFFTQLATKVICPLLRTYRLTHTRVVYFDEILTDNWEEQLESCGLGYNLHKTTYYDKVFQTEEVKKYTIK